MDKGFLFAIDETKTREILDDMINAISEEWIRRNKSMNEILSYMLRHQVTPPIKGEITKGKIRWRGLKIVMLHPEGTFMGLQQRDKLITPDWAKIKMKHELEDFLMFGIARIENEYEKAKQYCKGDLWNQIEKEE